MPIIKKWCWFAIFSSGYVGLIGWRRVMWRMADIKLNLSVPLFPRNKDGLVSRPPELSICLKENISRDSECQVVTKSRKCLWRGNWSPLILFQALLTCCWKSKEALWFSVFSSVEWGNYHYLHHEDSCEIEWVYFKMDKGYACLKCH